MTGAYVWTTAEGSLNTARQITVLAGAIVLMVTYGIAQHARPGDDVLLDVLVWGSHMGPLPIETLTGPLKAEAAAYLRRSAAYRSSRPAPARSNRELTMVYEANLSYERRLAATSDDPDAARRAVEYVTALRPCYEWEGFSDCPEREAIFADTYQAAHPAGPFSSYLPLLAAHRWLCAAEAFDNENRPKDSERARRLFAERTPAALASPSLLVRMAAARLSARNRCHAP